MKIIKLKKALDNCQLENLKDGHLENDFELIVTEDNEPEQKYEGKISINKIVEEEDKQKTKHKFSIKKITTNKGIKHRH